jgi:transcriptional regulator with XRE-family HTH domain
LTNLERFRRALGLTRADLAARIRKSAQIIEKYEAELPDELAATLAELARSMGREDAANIIAPVPSIAISDEPNFLRNSSEIYADSARHQGNTLVRYGTVNSAEGAESEWVSELLYILRFGDNDTIEAITRNINRFSLLTRVIRGEEDARGEINQIARQIALDPERRMAKLRELAARYPPRRRDTKLHEITAKKRKK